MKRLIENKSIIRFTKTSRLRWRAYAYKREEAGCREKKNLNFSDKFSGKKIRWKSMTRWYKEGFKKVNCIHNQRNRTQDRGK